MAKPKTILSRHNKGQNNTALLIIDMFNPLDFPEGSKLLKQALPITKRILDLKNRVKKLGHAVIYCNDNFGQWRSSLNDTISFALNSKGKPLAKLLMPEPDDYFILKPQHSAFYFTPLEILLDELKVSKIIITGISGNICVLFSANDAHMRKFKIWVPQDCIASNSKKENNIAINELKNVLRIKVSNSTNHLRF